jgi:hypothetical protein
VVLSPFYLPLGNEPLQHGLRVAGAPSVLAAAVALVAIGGIVFARRDLAWTPGITATEMTVSTTGLLLALVLRA